MHAVVLRDGRLQVRETPDPEPGPGELLLRTLSTGVDAVADFMEQVHALAGHTLHRLTNQAITLHGDTATARTYIDGLIMAGDNSSGVNAIGFYDDDIVRTPAGWRIARRRYTQVRITTVGGG
ncbi:nuclear transport factor 2 family protein [Mycobacterium colombiense]|uniref:nuclear transport factor 2 family protein n=1 Tax=Mycobacterium colombiense TaxID=339268 RepID=UPI001F0CB91C|nr:nuclear transport factor 2 family protein [Mycobacterium colombiense]